MALVGVVSVLLPLVAATGCASGPTLSGTPEIRVDRVVDQFGNTIKGTVDITRLAPGWKVRVVASEPLVAVKASAYDSKATMSHGSFPTSPTVGDEYYYNGHYYGYCGTSYGWAPRVPGAASITKDGSSAAWVTFATTTKAMAVVVVGTFQGQTVGMPLVVGVDPNAELSFSFPPVTTVVVGQPYVITIIGGNVSWQIPSSGIGLYTVYGGKTYLVGVLTMNSNNELVVVFNQNLTTILNLIPQGDSETLTITFTVDGNDYYFTITVIGCGGGGGGDGTGGVDAPVY